MSITQEQVEWLKGQVPEGLNPDAWRGRIERLFAPSPFCLQDEASGHVLAELYAAAKRREATAKGEIPRPDGWNLAAWNISLNAIRSAAEQPPDRWMTVAMPRDLATHVLAALAHFGQRPEPPKPAEQPKPEAAYLVKAGDELAEEATEMVDSVRCFAAMPPVHWERFVKPAFERFGKAVEAWNEAKADAPAKASTV